uniref:Uncharacterized protein n=1 Tax=Rhizophora mucronata TaxID=61149 RepID=A0A2P2J0B0_RHIMU
MSWLPSRVKEYKKQVLEALQMTVQHGILNVPENVGILMPFNNLISKLQNSFKAMKF